MRACPYTNVRLQIDFGRLGKLVALASLPMKKPISSAGSRCHFFLLPWSSPKARGRWYYLRNTARKSKYAWELICKVKHSQQRLGKVEAAACPPCADPHRLSYEVKRRGAPLPLSASDGSVSHQSVPSVVDFRGTRPPKIGEIVLNFGRIVRA